MGRKILFITTDQQRYDALGCNGGTIARTPNIDALSKAGITFDRAHPQNVVCMPSRSTMITGQHVSTHGVWMNGVPLPQDAPSIAGDLRAVGYSTALIGKAHFEPLLDPFLRLQKIAWAMNAKQPTTLLIHIAVLTTWSYRLTAQLVNCIIRNGFATITLRQSLAFIEC